MKCTRCIDWTTSTSLHGQACLMGSMKLLWNMQEKAEKLLGEEAVTYKVGDFPLCSRYL